jgi:hypothetical protein
MWQPGAIEEALIGVADEAGLTLGMALQPQAQVDTQGAVSWRFVPLTGVAP